MSDKGKSRMLGVILGILLALMGAEGVRGQTRVEMENIRRSTTLTPEDFRVMESFITGHFRSMESATEMTDLNKPLLELEGVSTSTSSNIQTRQQYLGEFARIVKENYNGLYQQGVNQARQAEPAQKELGENKKLAAAVVLVMSDHPILIEDLKRLLGDESALVRGCAIKGFTRDNLREQLIRGEMAGELGGILSSLDVLLNTETSAEAIMYAAATAGLVDNPQSMALLKKCVSGRVEQYKSWQVNRESADVEILEQVFKVAQQKLAATDRRGATDLLRSAMELYTAAYHRYRMGKAYRTAENKAVPLLTEENQQALKSLLMVGEKEFMQICNIPTNSARMAVLVAFQDASEVGLPNAIDSLIGPAGKVQQTFSIYDGWTMPGELPAPSAEIVQKAENLQKIKGGTIIIIRTLLEFSGSTLLS